MNAPRMIGRAGIVVLVSLLASCATWNEMDRTEKGTAAGATGGALAGAAIGGPVGAAVGAGVGGYVGHNTDVRKEDGKLDVDWKGPRPGGSDANAARSASADRSGASAGATTGPISVALDSELVRSIQQSLRDKGFQAGEPDGIWGPNTETALRNFQQANNLAATGKLDQQTLAALNVVQNGQAATTSPVQNQASPSAMQNSGSGSSAATGSTGTTGNTGNATTGAASTPGVTGTAGSTGTTNAPGSGLSAQ